MRAPRIISYLLGALVVASPAALAQVAVSPSILVIDAKHRDATVTLTNGSTTAVEAGFSTQFGYPATDSAGRLFLQTYEMVPDSMPSATTWIHSPDRVVLAPGERRTVLVRVSVPTTARAGEYWARLAVTTHAAASQSPVSVASASANVGLTVQVRSLVPVYVRVGAVKTGLSFGKSTATLAGDSIALRVPLHREGNAAFVGAIRATIQNMKGNTVARDSVRLGVYYDIAPRLALRNPSLKPGRYTVKLEATAGVSGIDSSMLLPSKDAHATTELVVQVGR